MAAGRQFLSLRFNKLARLDACRCRPGLAFASHIVLIPNFKFEIWDLKQYRSVAKLVKALAF